MKCFKNTLHACVTLPAQFRETFCDFPRVVLDDSDVLVNLVLVCWNLVQS